MAKLFKSFFEKRKNKIADKDLLVYCSVHRS